MNNAHSVQENEHNTTLRYVKANTKWHCNNCDGSLSVNLLYMMQNKIVKSGYTYLG